MQDIFLYKSNIGIYLLSIGLMFGIGRASSTPVQNTLKKSANVASLTMADVPDSCISYYAGGQALSKTIFRYTTPGLLDLASNFAWDADKQLWQADHQAEYQYDTKGNLVSDIGTQYDESNKPSIYYKNLFSYTDNNDLSTQEYYTYDALRQNLAGVSRFEYFYNASGSPESVIEYTKSDVPNNWTPSTKSIYGYTNDTIQSSYEIYKYHDSAGIWAKNIKNVQIYNSAAQLESEENYTASGDNNWQKYSRTVNEYQDGKLTISTLYNSNGIDWVASTRSTYGYSGGKVVVKLTSLYNPTSSVWANAFKDSTEYLANGKLYKQTAFKWDENSSSWIAVSKDVHGYDSENTLEQYFYSSDGQWVGTQKTVQKYDVSGNNLLSEKYAWNQETSSWIPSSKIEKMYDGETQKINSAIKYSLGANNGWQGYVKQDYKYEELFDSSVGLKFVHHYDGTASGWNYSNYTEYFYSTKQTSIDGNQERNFIRIAWSPEQIITVASNVEIRQTSVYSVNGAQRFVGQSQRISTNGWENGIYIVKVETADGKRTVKKIDVY